MGGMGGVGGVGGVGGRVGVGVGGCMQRRGRGSVSLVAVSTCPPALPAPRLLFHALNRKALEFTQRLKQRTDAAAAAAVEAFG